MRGKNITTVEILSYSWKRNSIWMKTLSFGTGEMAPSVLEERERKFTRASPIVITRDGKRRRYVHGTRSTELK